MNKKNTITVKSFDGCDLKCECSCGGRIESFYDGEVHEGYFIECECGKQDFISAYILDCM